MTKHILMLGTRFDTMGGIASVVNVYREAGLFDRWPISYLSTHCDGNAVAKMKIFVWAWLRYLALLFTGSAGLIHVHVSSRTSFWRKSLFILPGSALRVPTLLHLHGSEFAIFYDDESNWLTRRMIRYVFDNASSVIVLSDAWRLWVSRMSHNPDIRVIYNPVSVPKSETSWEKRRPAAGLSLGRLGLRKGTYDLLAATAQVQEDLPELRLLLGGDGERAPVLEKIRILNLEDRIELLGWVTGDEKRRQLETAFFYVLPSYNEGLPMSVLEAMAHGLPIISTPIGGIPEAVTDGLEGFLVEPGDIGALSDRITQLVSKADLAAKMGKAARGKIQRVFSAEVLLPKVENLYLELGMAPHQRPAK